MADDDVPRILRPLAARLRPALATFVPAAAALDAAGLERLLARVDARLAQEEPALQRQIRLFVHVLHLFPLVGYGHTLAGLTPSRREAFLARVEASRLPKFRVGLWGLRTLLFLGWYGDPEVQARLGYRPDPRGWEAFEAPGRGAP